jgi:branched-chain amino acid transport system permease protein
MTTRFPWAASAKGGLTGGAVVIYLAMVGMIESFSDLYLVGTSLTLGRFLLELTPLLAGYIALRPRTVAGTIQTAEPVEALARGALTGFLTGAVAAGWVWLVELVAVERVRNVFASVTPTLMQILTFGHGTALGMLILVVGGTVFGAIGGLGRVVSPRIRRPVVTGVAVVVSMSLFERILQPMLYQLGLSTVWLYSPITLGLTYLGAASAFTVSAVAAAVWAERREVFRGRVQGTPQGKQALQIAFGLLAGLLLMALPRLVGAPVSQILGTVGIYVLLGLGLNIVVGYAGLLDLGYVAFFAVGAYFTALLTGARLITPFGLHDPAFSLHLVFYVALPIVAFVAAVVGLFIGGPVLRLRGDYLAIVTLGFGAIATVLVTSNWLSPAVGGAEGMRDVTAAPILGLGFRDPQHFYYLVMAVCLIAGFVSWRLANSRVGRAWSAMREDEQVAEAMGINTVRYKLLAFAIGGAIGALGGALFAVQIGSLTPFSFKIDVSLTALAIIILGGMGSVPGVVVGALVLVGLPQLLSEFEEYKLLIYGAVLIAIMVLRPEGLIPNVRRTRELHEDERLQDAWAKGVPEAEPSTFSWEETPS